MKDKICGRSRFLLVCLLFCLPVMLTAHPHMQFTSTAEFVWKGKVLQGVFLEWAFDPYFSADIIRGYDVNQDGQFSPAEVQDVFDNAFSNLRHYYYFTFVSQNGRRDNPKTVEQFSVWQKNGTLYYRFFVDLSSWEPGTIRLAIYDYTFFCDIRYPEKNPITLTFDPAVVQPSWEVRENRDNPVYYNPMGAVDDNTIYYKWKQGLETYYPREIWIIYE